MAAIRYFTSHTIAGSRFLAKIQHIKETTQIPTSLIPTSLPAISSAFPSPLSSSSVSYAHISLSIAFFLLCLPAFVGLSVGLIQ